MIIFPAIDLQNGKAVRLKKGVATDSTVFSDDPVQTAKEWVSQGAKWLHIVDLDGAFSGEPVNLGLVKKIVNAISIPVQLGGGIRDLKTAKAYLDAGVNRLIIGTVALENPELFSELCKTFPGRIGVSLDCSNGELKTKGWVGATGLTVEKTLPALLAQGASFVIYTDIERDGMQTGVNLTAMQNLLNICNVPVIAAGGVASLEDIKRLYPLSKNTSFSGAISGRAIYEGTLNLKEAQSWIDAQN
ncbi:1-(5-phosphoribosyl)-5-[(5-phosphoribosylamino)methylideneamino]imidazole-4-carboxamide isomerase [Desulfovibrio litoralis]|uniref:1-(5-phosphoribosyl)-5-[(5-phosphoribosylamino)methylideneamino] imidazole-4-carboxamide isomerase n=1 Tax=Desulfovibrio litoralis DSM 11393 TaxID=1121455 RepID=A0A1M7STA9_9BACT|nr:1-(5-phosphoribosyl)-5-[(5-phosphoribosylamino)methylideneamino]imidazole-4-carboxamide isomerase [Desulfovibrio litoralis]SHN61709.1 1-(5-phosphoribosyl)-5-[(5-phosphoribosylamino)methylideneamino] imidazole-4-carboxamide isomerase [Desulfovibrio litoralis DSM 11393]